MGDYEDQKAKIANVYEEFQRADSEVGVITGIAEEYTLIFRASAKLQPEDMVASLLLNA